MHVAEEKEGVRRKEGRRRGEREGGVGASLIAMEICHPERVGSRGRVEQGEKEILEEERKKIQEIERA